MVGFVVVDCVDLGLGVVDGEVIVVFIVVFVKVNVVLAVVIFGRFDVELIVSVLLLDFDIDALEAGVVFCKVTFECGPSEIIEMIDKYAIIQVSVNKTE